MPELLIEVMDRPEAFFGLGEVWRALLVQSAQDNLYLTHEYLCAWWKHLSGTAHLRVILVREEGALVAAAPMMLTRGQLLKCPVRRLEFIGSGWGYGGFVLTKRKRECQALMLAALQWLPGWDVIYLGSMIGDPEVDAADLSGLMRGNGAVHDGERVGIPFIPMSMTWETYLAERSPSFRRNLKNRSRKLNALGRVRFQRIRRTEQYGDGLPALMEALRVVADRSWKARTGTAISSDAHVFAFYRELVERLSESGHLDVSLLWIDEKPVAYILGATYKDDFLEIDIAFDMELSKASPGVFLRNCLLQELFRQGYRTYDFVAYFDYKKELTSHVRDFDVHIAYRRAPYPLLLQWLRAAVRRTMARRLSGYSDLSWGIRPSRDRMLEDAHSSVS